MKIDFIADTNFLIYVHEGQEFVRHFLDYSFGVSFVTELELLGHPGLTKTEEKALKAIIKDCVYLDWNQQIKEQTIELRKKYAIKLPDALIASTAIVTKTPLISSDKGFEKIIEMDLVLLDF